MSRIFWVSADARLPSAWRGKIEELRGTAADFAFDLWLWRKHEASSEARGSSAR